MAKKTKAPAKKKPAAKLTPALGDDQIGLAAGQVWQVLNESGPQSAAALKKAIALPADIVMAGIGWLAREEKLEFVPTGRTIKLSLR